MKVAVMTQPGCIQFSEVSAPEPEPNDVLIEVKATGICGSDLHFFSGRHPYARYPQVYGHEICGKVKAVGTSVTKFKPGDRVVVEPAVPCGECYPCRIGKYNCCSNIDMVGLVRQGGFAEQLTVSADHVYKIPDSMSYEIGALCEPFTIGAQIVSRANPRPGSTVTVLGAGPIGLTVVCLLKQLHSVKVFVSDVVPERLQKAKMFGADEVVNAKTQDVIQHIMEATDHEGSNVVIESAGLPATMEQTIHLVSPGGRIVIAGLTQGNICFPGILFTNKEVEIYGSRNNVDKFPEVIRFLDTHQDLAHTYITHKMPFEDIVQAFEFARDKPSEVNKLVLQFD